MFFFASILTFPAAAPTVHFSQSATDFILPSDDYALPVQNESTAVVLLVAMSDDKVPPAHTDFRAFAGQIRLRHPHRLLATRNLDPFPFVHILHVDGEFHPFVDCFTTYDTHQQGCNKDKR